MSFESPEETSGDERRAAHVKWDGKTIALGTFSAQEAADKCNQAKALTKKWRTTMIPKPDVEWVKNTLERLNIRVVNDRPGRRKKRNINEVENIRKSSSSTSPPSQLKMLNLAQSRDQMLRNQNNLNSEAGMQVLAGRGANTNFSPLGGDAERRFSNPSQYGGNPQQRGFPNSVLASLPTNVYNRNNAAQARYENPSRDFHNDHLRSTNTLPLDDTARMGQRSNDTQQQLANLVFGSNQHYEVLKEHHMNLLKELQETTTLMDMYHRNNSQQNMDLGAARMQNRDSLDPYLDQSLFGGSNQHYTSPTATRDSLGIGGNFQGLGMSQLSQQYEALRRDSLRQGGQFNLPSNETGQPNDRNRDAMNRYK